MKRVFSPEKFFADITLSLDHEIENWQGKIKEPWWVTCAGLTKGEIEALGYHTCDEWMKEVEHYE